MENTVLLGQFTYIATRCWSGPASRYRGGSCSFPASLLNQTENKNWTINKTKPRFHTFYKMRYECLHIPVYVKLSVSHSHSYRKYKRAWRPGHTGPDMRTKTRTIRNARPLCVVIVIVFVVATVWKSVSETSASGSGHCRVLFNVVIKTTDLTESLKLHWQHLCLF